MDAQELHDACYDAMCQCPQFRGWDDDGEFSGYGQFGKIPSKGLYKTIQFWREWGDLLWERGYEKALPQEAQDLFDNIERVIEQAIKDYCKGPRKTTPPAAQPAAVAVEHCLSARNERTPCPHTVATPTAMQSDLKWAVSELEELDDATVQVVVGVLRKHLCTPPPAAQPAPVQEPRHIVQSNGRHSPLLTHMMNSRNTPPAAQRTWVGLTGAELADMHATLMVKLRGCYETKDLYRAIEAKLKEKNT